MSNCGARIRRRLKFCAREKFFEELIEMPASKKIVPEDAAGHETPRWESVLCEYLNFLSGCGRSKNTITIYKDHVSRFYREKNPEWDDEKESFFIWNGEPHIYSNHRLDACRRFWAWAVISGHRKSNPAKIALRRITNKHPVANVSMSDIEKLVRAFRDEHNERPEQWERLRNYTYIMFAIGTGIRPGEGLKLRRDDFNIDERFAVVHAEYSKTRQSRVVYFPQSAALSEMLRRMMDIQAAKGLPSASPLFSDAKGRELQVRSWFHIINKCARQISIRIKPYDFRHAFITHSLSDGANPYDLRDQVGHSNMEMMKRYYHSNADVRRNTANLSPLRKISHN
jgi:integrase